MEQGSSTANTVNRNVRDTRAEHQHAAVETPHLSAVQRLKSGTPGYKGRHRAE